MTRSEIERYERECINRALGPFRTPPRIDNAIQQLIQHTERRRALAGQQHIIQTAEGKQ